MNHSDYHLSPEEIARLGVQSSVEMMDTFIPYVENIGEMDNPVILDIGCGSAMQMISRLGPISNYKYIGLDIDPEVVKQNNERFSETGNVHCYVCDIDSNLMETVDSIKKELNIERFDVLNVSLVLKHIKDRTGLLNNCYKIMDENSVLFINEYDAGENIFYPDDYGYFKKINEIFERDKTLGDRYTGRKCYTWLMQAGFTNIEIPLICSSTAGKSEVAKNNLWNAEFDYLTQDCREMVEKYGTQEYKDDLKWCEENLEKARLEFIKPEFIYFTGTMLYVARK